MDEWELVLCSDPIHSEEHIVGLLMDCIPNMSSLKATNLWLIGSTNGRVVVYRGFLEHVEHFSEKMMDYPLELKEGSTVAPPVMVEIIDPSGRKVKTER